MSKPLMFGSITVELDRVIQDNALAYAIFDGYPVTKGHILIIPKRIEASYFKLTIEEQRALLDLLEEMKRYLDVKYHPDGYNVGWNDGEAAGQTILHCHIHLIPRYSGDSEDPRGGVRGVIPHKQKYEGT
jgi:diadenosine tetraphosphate (Ap4A) HIT family hydrolase